MKHGGKRAGSGRKPLHDVAMESLSFRVPVEIKDWIRSEAGYTGKSMSEVVTEILKEKME